MKKTGLTFTVVLLAAVAMASCRIDTILGYKYDPGLSTRNLASITVNHYNADNILDTITSIVLTTGGDWRLIGRTIYTLNPAGLITSYTSQGYDTTIHQWKDGNRGLYFYDGSDNCIQRVYQNWIAGTGVWDNSSMQESSYDNNRNAVSYTNKYWTGSAWINASLDSFYYTPTNKELLRYNFYWNVTRNAWDRYSRNTTYYTTDDSIAQEYTDYYDTATGFWRSGYQVMYYYNGDSKLYLKQTGRWNNSIFDYANYYKTTYTYDVANRLVEENEQDWNETSSTWVNRTKYAREYDVAGEYVASEAWAGWLVSGSYYQYHSREEYKCAVATAVSDIPHDPDFAVYPNPVTNGALHITTGFAQPFALYDLSGKVIAEGRLQPGDNVLAVPAVAPGMYLLKTAGNARKLIVE